MLTETSPSNPNPDLRPGVLKFGAWSGIIFIVLCAFGWVVLAKYIPPPSPQDSAEEIAARIADNRDGIRAGMILVMFSAVFLAPFAALISIQMRRIEGRSALLAWTQFGLGAILVLAFIYLAFFWQAATFRDRPADDIQLVNDMAWIPFIGLTATAAMQSAVFGLAILMDRRTRPIFPRWLGYFNLWAAMLFCPGSFNVFFKSGPFAWNGLMAYYVPLIVFAAWMIVNSWALLKAVDHQVEEEGTAEPAVPRDPTSRALEAEVAALRERVDELGTAPAGAGR